MKKILSFIISLVMLFSVASAQTVESSRLLENTSITLSGGVITPQLAGDQTFLWDGVAGAKPLAAIELSKYVTPVVGFGLEYVALFNTTGSCTVVDQHNLVSNLKLNLSNWFGGYPGEPRLVEVVFVPGLGWSHDYGDIKHPMHNYWTYNIGTEINFNLGKEKAWQINVKPVAQWTNYARNMRLYKQFFHTRLQVGITYKFGSKSKKSHNFVVSPYSVTKSDYDAALASVKSLENKVDELESREPEVVEKVVTKEVVVEKQVLHDPAISTVITFPIGSAELTAVERAKLGVFAKAVRYEDKVRIVGSADSSTGSEDINQLLAECRANNVRSILVVEYGIPPQNIIISTAFDTNSLPEASRSVVITLE